MIDSSANKAESPAHSSAKVRHLTQVAFPLRQASLDLVQQKTVRHGLISMLLTWPTRLPVARAG